MVMRSSSRIGVASRSRTTQLKAISNAKRIVGCPPVEATSFKVTRRDSAQASSRVLTSCLGRKKLTHVPAGYHPAGTFFYPRCILGILKHSVRRMKSIHFCKDKQPTGILVSAKDVRK